MMTLKVFPVVSVPAPTNVRASSARRLADLSRGGSSGESRI